MRTSIEGGDGWIEVVRGGVSVLAKGDADLRARLETALDAAADDDLADVATDELTTGGVRRAPDFAILDEVGGRVLVRGDARAVITDDEGGTREVRAPARGPWSDEDLGHDVGRAVLTGGEPRVSEPVAPERETPEPVAPVSGGGWALPSVFGAKSGAVPAHDPGETGGTGEARTPGRPDLTVVPAKPTPIEEATVIETPAPAGQELIEDLPSAGAGSVGAESAAQDELPSFDFLFGNTHRHRSSLQPEDADQGEEGAPIDAGPVAAAGGYRAPEDPAHATLAPPMDEEDTAEEPPAAAEPAVGRPPMPGSTPSLAGPEVAPRESGPAARDDSGGHDPVGTSPQFFNGHLVGSRVQGPSAAGHAVGDPADSADPGDPEVAEGDGMISSVPWGAGAPVGAPAGPVSPANPANPVSPANPASPPTQEPSASAAAEAPTGPMVLAVRCSAGHHNAPHATRCRVCGRDLPTQQPEQTPRPALGLLRLSTGDVVTLDRGVLIGRAPRADIDIGGAHVPHLVRISSPDNEISRNHVEIVLDGWHVLVRDLGSTNGTTIALPGSSPVRVRPGDQQTIEPGATITLADQVSMVFEVTG